MVVLLPVFDVNAGFGPISVICWKLLLAALRCGCWCWCTMCSSDLELRQCLSSALWSSEI